MATTELLAVGPMGGLDATSTQYMVEGNNLTDILNFVPNRRYGSFITAQGRVEAFPNGLTGPTQYGIVKFFGTPGTNLSYLIASTFSGALQIYVGDPVNKTTSRYGPGFTNNGAQVSFAQYQNWMFFSYGNVSAANTQLPAKFGQTDYVISNWQYLPPAAAPSVATSGGALTGTYYYRYTYSDGTQETSPGPATAGNTVSGQQFTATVVASAEAGITTINLYRLGGTLSSWLLVGTRANTNGTIVDNTADSAVTGQSMILHRDVPPNFFAIESHKDRMWGFGHNGYNVPVVTAAGQADLWYSNYKEPWGFDNTNQVIPVGQVVNGDIAVGLASLSSVLAVHKTKSFWVVYGDSGQDFIVRKVGDVGTISKASIAKGYGLDFWLSESGVFMYDGNTLQNISDGNNQLGGIKKILDGLSLADKQAAAGFIHDRGYYISFPTQGVTYMYNMRSQQWSKLGFAGSFFAMDLDNTNYPGGEVLSCRPSSARQDFWFAAETDLGLNIAGSFTTKLSDFSGPGSQGSVRMRYVQLESPVQVGTATITTTAQTVSGQVSNVNTINMNNLAVRTVYSLPPAFVGNQAQFQLTTSSSALTEIDRLSLWGWPERRLTVPG